MAETRRTPPDAMTLDDRLACDYGTPLIAVDLDRVEANIARLQAACDAAGLGNRPHIKTHKSPELAILQRAAGARGIACQKLGEAEIMADAGFGDILIAYNLIGSEKAGRLAALLRRGVSVTVAADNPTTLATLAEAAALAGRDAAVVVECDTGMNRAGVTNPGEAVALAREAAATPGLDFAGLMLYPPEGGTAATRAFLEEALAGLRDAGLGCRIVSNGGTPNVAHLGEIAGPTEHRAGTYIFNDRMMIAAGMATLDDCALHVVTTVVSRAAPERGILDAGSKTLTSDAGGGLDGHGHIVGYPQARIPRMSEEHGFLDLSASNARPRVGEVVRVVPNHVCVVVNMFDRMIATRGDEIVGELPVAARGRVS